VYQRNEENRISEKKKSLEGMSKDYIKESESKEDFEIPFSPIALIEPFD
jgi:hypothetical protein